LLQGVTMPNIPQMLPLTTEILGLSDVEIIKIELDRENQFIITVESTKKEIPCHQCGQPTEPYGKGRTVRLRHLPILGKKTFIEITPPRGRCPDCDNNPTTTQQANWYDRKSPHTKAYEKHVLFSLINSTIIDVSIKEDLGYQAIQAIVDRQIEAEVNWKLIKELGLLGIDEISLKKGHSDYVTLVTSRVHEETRIVAVLAGHEKSMIKAFLSSIPKRLCKTIAAVCTDMYDGYVNAAKEVFGKKIPVIVDRFHVAQLYRKSLVSLRKRELKRLKKLLSEEQYRALKPAIAILCHHKEFMTPEEKKIVEPLFNQAPLLKVAYNFCCKLTEIYNSYIDPKTAHQKINVWIMTVEKSGLVCFNKFIKTLKKYQPEIENYFISRDTSGFVEGFNNKAKVLKRRCYGLFNLKHFFQRLLLDFSGYALFGGKQGNCYA
jgi:transposase